jgi:hypothetical protein
MKYEIELHAQNTTDTLRQLVIVDTLAPFDVLHQIRAFMLSVLQVFEGQQATLRLILPDTNGLTYQYLKITSHTMRRMTREWSNHCKHTL